VDPLSSKLGFLAPVYRKEGSDNVVYSHHHEGRIWLVGRNFNSWSMRMDLRQLQVKPVGRKEVIPT
jgi:hypothetical protein